MNYDEINVPISDGSHKPTAINQGKRWMNEIHITEARLVINSMKTDNIIEIIDIKL